MIAIRSIARLWTQWVQQLPLQVCTQKFLWVGLTLRLCIIYVWFKNYVMKIISQSPSQRLVRLQRKLILIKKSLYIHKFLLPFFSVFQCTSHQPSVYLDWSINHVKPLISIIMSMKSVFFKFCFWGEGGWSLALHRLGGPICCKVFVSFPDTFSACLPHWPLFLQLKSTVQIKHCTKTQTTQFVFP